MKNELPHVTMYDPQVIFRGSYISLSCCSCEFPILFDLEFGVFVFVEGGQIGWRMHPLIIDDKLRHNIVKGAVEP